MPRELAVLLANDEIEVATPILMRSAVLQDVDLIEIIRHRSRQHILAVAMRRDLTSTVSEALVETGDRDVIRTLLENQDANIARITLAYLVEQSKTVDEFQEPLVRRRDLPADLARRLVYWVAASLRQALIERFDIDVDTLDDRLEPVVKEEIAEARGGSGGRQRRGRPVAGAGRRPPADAAPAAADPAQGRGATVRGDVRRNERPAPEAGQSPGL